MHRFTLGSPILLAAAILSLFAFVVVASTAKAADLAAAKKVYDDKCAKCHGDTGKGDGPKAKTLKKKPRDYTNKAEMAKFTDANGLTAAFIRLCSRGPSTLRRLSSR